MGYYVNTFNIQDRNVCTYLDKPKWFEMSDWTAVLKKPCWIPMLTPLLIKHAARKVKGYGDSERTSSQKDKPVEQTRKEIKNYIELERRLTVSNAALERRKLIKLDQHQSEADVKGVSLTIEGYDLGRKYSSWWARGGLWFAEYKDHWIWLIVGFLGGIVGALLVNWLARKIK